MPFQHQHDLIPAPDTERTEVVDAPIRRRFQITVGKTALVLIRVEVQEREFIRAFRGDGVDDVKAEIKVFRISERNACERAASVRLCMYETVDDEIARIGDGDRDGCRRGSMLHSR